MKFRTIFLLPFLITTFNVNAEQQTLENYLTNFDYDARIEMKAGTRELVDLLVNGKAQLIDIRFKEEFAAWQVGPSNNIPLNELPKRLSELDKNKIIVTACPHKDRAIIAMTFLKTKGYKTMYLKDGLIGLAEYLRGDNARDVMQQLRK